MLMWKQKQTCKLNKIVMPTQSEKHTLFQNKMFIIYTRPNLSDQNYTTRVSPGRGSASAKRTSCYNCLWSLGLYFNFWIPR